jgi:metal-responsive CopG/Arc/MetJ family transcriptional regulator
MPKFKSDKIMIYLGSKLKLEVEKLATDKEMSISEFIRYLIIDYIENRKNK